MKPTKPTLQRILFSCLLICSFSCFVFMSSLENPPVTNNQKIAPNDQVEEVAFPDVFAIKDLVEKLVKYLPAS